MIGRLVEKHNIGLWRERAASAARLVSRRKAAPDLLAVSPSSFNSVGRDGDHRWAKPAST